MKKGPRKCHIMYVTQKPFACDCSHQNEHIHYNDQSKTNSEQLLNVVYHLAEFKTSRTEVAGTWKLEKEI